MDQIGERLQVNLSRVNERIRQACDRAGRSADEVQLVAVTKYAEWKWVQNLAKHHTVFGENRPQQLADRFAKMPEADWHLIGQLQRNKVRLAVYHSFLIHSVDSVRLYDQISQAAGDISLNAKVLLQCNISGEETKSGFTAEEVIRAAEGGLLASKHVNISGLMTMAPAAASQSELHDIFSKLRSLRDQLSSALQRPMPRLSMGMSGDFEIAIAEGATHVRIGSLLYEGLSQS